MADLVAVQTAFDDLAKQDPENAYELIENYFDLLTVYSHHDPEIDPVAHSQAFITCFKEHLFSGLPTSKLILDAHGLDLVDLVLPHVNYHDEVEDVCLTTQNSNLTPF